MQERLSVSIEMLHHGRLIFAKNTRTGKEVCIFMACNIRKFDVSTVIV